MFRVLVTLISAATLAGCVSSSNPTGSDALTTAMNSVGPDGRPAQMVTCGEVAWCMNRATAVCAGRAPVVLATAQPQRDYLITYRCA